MKITLRSIPSQPVRTSAFSLIELIVAVTIMAILAGAAVPITSKVLTYRARQATSTELQTLSDASAAYFRDTSAIPADIESLLVVPKGTSGWSGPYLPGVVTDSITGLTGYQVDAWSRAYTTGVSGDVLTITSMAEDAKKATSDDLSIQLDVTPIRREMTVDRLETINQAVTLYNGTWHKSAPLSTSWTSAYAQLVAKGYLPSSLDYQVDAWGDAYHPDPKGIAPVVKVTSPNVSSTSSSSGTSGGSSKDKGKAKGKEKNEPKGKAKGHDKHDD